MRKIAFMFITLQQTPWQILLTKCIHIRASKRVNKYVNEQNRGRGKIVEQIVKHKKPHSSPVQKRNLRNVSCFNCNESGHYSGNCPLWKQAKVHAINVRSQYPTKSNLATFKVDGREVLALLDTGSKVDALINSSLVNEKKHLVESVQVSFANRIRVTLTLVDVHLKYDFETGTVRAMIVQNLGYDMILGSTYVLLWKRSSTHDHGGSHNPIRK